MITRFGLRRISMATQVGDDKPVGLGKRGNVAGEYSAGACEAVELADFASQVGCLIMKGHVVDGGAVNVLQGLTRIRGGQEGEPWVE